MDINTVLIISLMLAFLLCYVLDRVEKKRAQKQSEREKLFKDYETIVRSIRVRGKPMTDARVDEIVRQIEVQEDHAAIIEKMRTDNTKAIQSVEENATIRIEAAEALTEVMKKRAKVAEDERDDMHKYREDSVARMQIEIDTLCKNNARELHD